jgi:hypothetical protein
LATDVVPNHFCLLGSAQAICENDSLKMLWRSWTRDASILR